MKVLANGIEVATNTALPAGPVAQAFTYDDLYQIKTADGEYLFGPSKQNKYHNEFVYDTIGNITKKDQSHWIIQPSTTKLYPKETNYVLNYVYGSTKPHAVTDAGDKLYSYDPAGNMTGWTSKTNGTRRTITWNEENRVKQIDDNGKATYFLYDDAGERVVKRGQHGESIYVNRFYAVRNGELGTKHVFAGETRVVSKLVKTPNTVTANTTNQTNQTNTTTGNSFPNQGTDQALSSGRGKKLGIIRRLPDGYQVGINPPVEKDEFFYHGDHLGSSNMITDAYGAVYQHLEYFPYGETWIEEGGSYGGNTPGYKFTGKELDPETGLYYFGARYYDPVLSKWISADPMFEKYLPYLLNEDQLKNYWRPEIDLPGIGGVFNPANLNLYGYTHQNPIKFIDPDGKELARLIFDKNSAISGKGVVIVDKTFAPVVMMMNEEAKSRGIKIVITNDFRPEGAKLKDVVAGVTPSKESRHKAGRALDVNLIYKGKRYTSAELNNINKLPKEVAEFIKSIESLQVSTPQDEKSKIRWGGRWKTKDGVHFELQTTKELYKKLYEENQKQSKGEAGSKSIETIRIDSDKTAEGGQ